MAPVKEFQIDVSSVRANSLRIRQSVRSDEGLTLETSALKLNSVDNTKLLCYTLPSTKTSETYATQILVGQYYP